MINDVRVVCRAGQRLRLRRWWRRSELVPEGGSLQRDVRSMATLLGVPGLPEEPQDECHQKKHPENERDKLQRQHGPAMTDAKISKNGKGKDATWTVAYTLRETRTEDLF